MTTHIPSRDSADRAMVGASPAFLAMLEQVSQVAALDKPVLVIGERGTGKELVAGRLHYLS
ncbi:MAG: sigma 54-interacting transcriptional regulator, partial [Gammaproteobacteria bacterium]